MNQANQKSVTPEELRKFWYFMLNQAAKTPEYHMLNSRRYRTPAGYADFSSVALKLACHANCLRELACLDSLSQVNPNDAFSESIVYPLSIIFAHDHAPVYWLGAELLEAIRNTELPPHVASDVLQRPIKMATIMLPKSKIITPDGEIIDHICFAHLLKGESIPLLEVNNKKRIISTQLERPELNQVIIFATTDNSTIYCSSTGLVHDESGKLDRGEWRPSPHYQAMYHKTNPQEVEQAFIKELERIVIQCILLLQVRPEFLEMGSPVGFGLSGAKPNSRDKIKGKLLLNPNWIGKNYQIRHSKRTPTSTHASPSMHWRRGHLRRVAVGQGRTNREWRWIEPVLVNAELS